MIDIVISFGSALWLGILTSISPCPLATNTAAVSFLSKKITHPALVFIAGLAYTLGRMTAYVVLSWIIVGSLLSIPQVAQFLQKYMARAIGPLLMMTGLVLLEKIKINLPDFYFAHKFHGKLIEAGAPGAFLLGLVFALSFCPVSAALFFGSLVPLCLNSKAGTWLALAYGAGTGLPVLVFAVAITLGVTSLSHWVHRVIRLEAYTRAITGVIFVIIGLYYTGMYLVTLR